MFLKHVCFLRPYPNTPVIFYYGAQVEVRYVAINPYPALASALNVTNHSITTDLVTLRGRQASHPFTGQALIRHTATFAIPPTGTCTTPSFTTIALGTLLEGALPAQGSAGAYRNVNLNFTNCPRTNIGYYVHANGKWVNSAQGIVGLSGSTPHADPAIGNPRGIGVQLAHNGGVHGTGAVYISPNVDDANKQFYWRTPAQGTDSATGVNHTIPLRARVIRTSPAGAPIAPGTFNTSLIFVMQYP